MIQLGRIVRQRRLASRKALVVLVKNGAENSIYKSILPKLDPSFPKQLEAAGGLPKTGKVRTFFGLNDEYPVVTIVGECDKDNSDTEGRDEIKENVRAAVANGVAALKGMGGPIGHNYLRHK